MANDEGFRLWGSRRRSAPPRPEYPELYPETDDRHWYDLEYAGWGVEKAPMPPSPRDGPAGKRVLCIHHLPGHPYMEGYGLGMAREAARFGVGLETVAGPWDPEGEADLVARALRARPDLVVVVPEGAAEGAELLRRIHATGIPAIASNLLPGAEGHRWCLCWTGPDDWGQFRLLARRFAALMGGEGGYCMVEHLPGSSAWYARRWAVVTELSRVAPRMELLDSGSTGLHAETTREAVLGWIDRFGDRLRGIICADDSLAQLGVNRALAERGRPDIIRVASGATAVGLRLLREGGLSAITAQSPELDGALPLRAAVDWWNGLELEPVRYLPIDLVEPGGVEDFLLMRHGEPAVDLDTLSHLVADCDLAGLGRWFAELRACFRQARLLQEDWFRGLTMELLSRLAAVARSTGTDAPPWNGPYDALYRGLFQRPGPGETLDWLEDLARRLVAAAGERRPACLPLADRLLLHVEGHWREPLSLKLLADSFGMSASYLGKVFHEATGSSFTSYLNERRIREAERLLAGRRLRAKDVALAVGYRDPNYFYAVFKRVTGRYPSEAGGGAPED